MSISSIENATAKLSNWVAKNGQSIGYTENQCVKLAAHGQAAIETMENLNSKNAPTLD